MTTIYGPDGWNAREAAKEGMEGFDLLGKNSTGRDAGPQSAGVMCLFRKICRSGLLFEFEALVLVGSPQTQSLYPILHEFGRGALSGSDLDGGPAFTHGLT